MKKDNVKKEIASDSVSAIVKAHILEAVKENQVMERKTLVEYVNKHMEEMPSDGVVAGAFKMLVASGELEVVRRGVYQKGSGKESGSAFSKVYHLCDKFKDDLNKVCTLNLLQLAPDDRKDYMELVDILSRELNQVNGFLEEVNALVEKRNTEVSEISEAVESEAEAS